MNPTRPQTRQRPAQAAGYLLLGEPIGLRHLVGGALIAWGTMGGAGSEQSQ